MGNCHYPQFAEVKLKPEGELTSDKTPRKWGQDHNYAHQYGMTSSSVNHTSLPLKNLWVFSGKNLQNFAFWPPSESQFLTTDRLDRLCTCSQFSFCPWGIPDFSAYPAKSQRQPSRVLWLPKQKALPLFGPAVRIYTNVLAANHSAVL